VPSLAIKPGCGHEGIATYPALSVKALRLRRHEFRLVGLGDLFEGHPLSGVL
jgi:hypothetical protein